MFKKILVANRGEIAVRIMRTCREMDIATVAVYSSADEAALHVLESDESVFLGDSEPSESYLNIDKIIDAAKKTGAQAVHPGYGFLAENPLFARRCLEEGITFIGPPADVVRNLGNKTTARSIMMKAGVPVIPGMTEPLSDIERLLREAERIGYPVLVKAVSGGGGKGMREVRDSADLAESCLAARREAEQAFGDGSVYLEKRLSRPRHVEFQILADAHGNVIHLFERECSIQRRHQKIIEETPSPALTPELREKMGIAAVAAARAAGYVNAGTIEFLLDESGAFYFLEVNTRLQVEHPVTELTTGLDLVRLQIEIAAGNKLGLRQEDIRAGGHAIECRIYAEDPENSFFPCPGKIILHREPSGPGVRNDCGVYSGFIVPVEYDPILSKLAVFASDREAARKRMLRALENYSLTGIKTTIAFLMDVIGSDAFRLGQTCTDFVDEHFSGWKVKDDALMDIAMIAHVADGLLAFKSVRQREGIEKGWSTPWNTLGEWKL
ncbi:MAG: pyruvate carboxylase subunit A [Deltaproteobacteria bacterium CG_4_8_14_3_um_filter_51_11]|nr:acetyl-CoA carboxylase biotin carboxylase subunit [bacterium]OIP43435.1 MAG: pyruvate carboxylase subunit A [Desulfobacteraceae bacterium CG2_30_51_40]PIP45469.1 MAG: pyruvate carboxylase subunit A [Deltaproteobacteria bacterium CG23_combo_of_CG06-09_8_20_14_all_51_20]PIX18097.1 MAG: pyruvate carboxylase subunit A [Deltaproteobacteria bacterium CG_4_8_14_3_um_filter_51_11]PIY23922.1 MAG: pyruvate carboxylase subunit A [Deltaproteobacteria bacterium CG_4_10_14_3_um_filter_51_14]PJB33928.1 MA